MAIRMINGFQIYAVTKEDVEYHPDEFQQQAQNWVEGSKRDKLSFDEIAELKLKYGSKNMSKEDTIALFGDLVEAGIMSTSTARDIYHGAVPLDVSKIDPTKPSGVLTKCDAAYERQMNALGITDGLGIMFRAGGLDSYRNWYEYAKSATDVDVENSRYFQEYRQFLGILEQIGA